MVTEDIRRRKEKEKNVAEVAGGSESSNESEAGSGSDTSEQINSAPTQSRPRQALNSNNSNGLLHYQKTKSKFYFSFFSKQGKSNYLLIN